MLGVHCRPCPSTPFSMRHTRAPAGLGTLVGNQHNTRDANLTALALRVALPWAKEGVEGTTGVAEAFVSRWASWK